MIALQYIAALSIVVGLLCIGAAVQEWLLWRSEQKRATTAAMPRPPSKNGSTV